MNIATPALLDKAKNKNNPTSGLLNSRPVCFYTDFVFVFEPRDETTLDHAIEKQRLVIMKFSNQEVGLLTFGRKNIIWICPR